MPIQAIDLDTATGVTFNGTNVTEVNLNGDTVWPYVAPSGIDVTTAFVPFSGFNVFDSENDTFANYSVSEIQVIASGSRRIYIGHKVTVSTTYYNDTPIGAVQVLDSTGTTVLRNYHFGNLSLNTGWTTTDRNVASSSSQGNLSESPAQAAALAYTTISTGGSQTKFNLASSTGSADTGAVDGIALPTSPLTLGNATTSQSLNQYYVYRETSGSVANSVTFMRSPPLTVSAGQRVRIAYIMGNRSQAEGHVQDPNDTLFLGII